MAVENNGAQLHVTLQRPALVEMEAFVRAFSPGSTLEPGLKGFHRRGH
jgi:hypothetical protein